MKKKAVLMVSGLLVLAGIIHCSHSNDKISVARDLVYGQSDGVDLKMDLARSSKGSGPFPAVVCIHGGAWQAGDKRDMDSFIRQFARNGYVAASVGYRLAPKYQWPAQIEDVKCAVRYLRAHAKDLNIDPNRLFATGASAGGHLALLLGLMEPKDGFEGNGGNPGEPSAVLGVANFFGPTDLATWNVATDFGLSEQKDKKTAAQTVLENFLGTSDRGSTNVLQASPIRYVHAGNPPILTFHGSRDEIVPLGQASALHESLKKAHVPEKLVVMWDDGHGWGGQKLKGSIREACSFFDTIVHNLKKPAPGPFQ